MLKLFARIGMLFALLLSVALFGCTVADLTPKQRAYDVLGKFNSAQIAAERAVTSPSVPVDIKIQIKRLEALARKAVLGYSDAVYAGSPDIAAYQAAAFAATDELVKYLVQRALMKESMNVDSAGRVIVAWLHYSGKGV